jgi:hypothetical protein
MLTPLQRQRCPLRKAAATGAGRARCIVPLQGQRKRAQQAGAPTRAKAPGFPTHIVGTPTRWGKARRYVGQRKADPSPRQNRGVRDDNGGRVPRAGCFVLACIALFGGKMKA